MKSDEQCTYTDCDLPVDGQQLYGILCQNRKFGIFPHVPLPMSIFGMENKKLQAEMGGFPLDLFNSLLAKRVSKYCYP